MATWRRWAAFSMILAVGLAAGCKKKPSTPLPPPPGNTPTTGQGTGTPTPSNSGVGSNSGGSEEEVVDHDNLAAKHSYRIALVGRGASDEVSRAILGSLRSELDAFASLHSLTLEIEDATPTSRSTSAQARAIEGVTGKNFDGIVVEADDDRKSTVLVEGMPTPAIAAGVDAARRGGADVVLTGTDFIASDRIAYVGQDESAVGTAAGEALAELMGNSGTCVIMAGPAARSELASRAEAAAAFLRGRGLTVHVVNHEEANVGTETGNAREAHPGATGWIFVAAWDEGPMPAEVNVVAVEPTTARLTALPSGEIDAVVASDYHGWGNLAIAALMSKLHLGQLPGDTESYFEPIVLTRGANGGDDGNAYLAQWREWLDRAK